MSRPLYKLLRSTYLNGRARVAKAFYPLHACDNHTGWDWNAVRHTRVDLVNRLVSIFPDCSYLEIGCGANSLFNAVRAARKVGVDPRRGGTLRQASDAFFAANMEKFDVIFVDGLHHYKQVRQDVIHAIAALKPGGFVAVHDMLPRNWVEAHVPKIIGHRSWVGDVWKLAFELALTDGIDFTILTIDHGVGVLRVTKPGVEVCNLCNELAMQPFSYFYEHAPTLPLRAWDGLEAWLATR